MDKTWIVAESCTDNSFRVIKIIQSANEPTDEFRKAIIELLKSYQDRKIPDTTVSIFMSFDKKGSDLLAQTAPDKISIVFELLKSSGRTGCMDTVSIQRSAWCHTKNMDVLEYSFQNGGGSGAKRLAVVNNNDFQTFRKEKCRIRRREVK